MPAGADGAGDHFHPRGFLQNGVWMRRHTTQFLQNGKCALRQYTQVGAFLSASARYDSGLRRFPPRLPRWAGGRGIFDTSARPLAAFGLPALIQFWYRTVPRRVYADEARA